MPEFPRRGKDAKRGHRDESRVVKRAYSFPTRFQSTTIHAARESLIPGAKLKVLFRSSRCPRVLSRSVSALIILITVPVIKPASLISAHFARGFDVDSVFRRACGYPRAWQQFEFERYSGGYRRLLRVQHQVQSLGLQGFLAP